VQGVFIGEWAELAEVVPHTLYMVALDDSSVWGFTIVFIDGRGLSSSLTQAYGTYAGNTFSATSGREYSRGMYSVSVSQHTMDASIAGDKFDGTLTDSSQPSSPSYFVTERISSEQFAYNQAASLADIASAWHGWSWGGISSGKVIPSKLSTVIVSSAGEFSGDLYGCPFTGSIAPRPSGKNIFNIKLTFADSALCFFPGEEQEGIAFSYQQQLIFGTHNAQRTAGLAWYGTR
jgi:hypothetical protein